MSWWTMGLYVAILFVSVFMHLFIEMPIATLWPYFMQEKWFKLIFLTKIVVFEFLPSRCRMELMNFIYFEYFYWGPFKANNFKNIINVKFRSLALIFCLIVNMSHLCKLGHRKKVLENFRRFISQEQLIRILSRSANCFDFKLLSKEK